MDWTRRVCVVGGVVVAVPAVAVLAVALALVVALVLHLVLLYQLLRVARRALRRWQPQQTLAAPPVTLAFPTRR
jgi:hypothetical protein